VVGVGPGRRVFRGYLRNLVCGEPFIGPGECVCKGGVEEGGATVLKRCRRNGVTHQPRAPTHRDPVLAANAAAPPHAASREWHWVVVEESAQIGELATENIPVAWLARLAWLLNDARRVQPA